MSSKTIKKLLLSLIVVGALGSFTARGTYAVLKGETSNSNDSLATGTLLLTQTWLGAASNGTQDVVCNSKDVSLNVNTGCFTILSSGTSMYPIPSAEPTIPTAGTYQTANISVTNGGTLPETLSVNMPSCTYAATAGAPTVPAPSWTAVNPCCPNTASGSTPGGGNACQTGSLDFFIQETNAPTGSPNRSYTTKSSCVWPVSAVAACTFQVDSFETFWTGYHDTSSYLSLGSLAAGTTRYFQIAVAEPSAAVQGLQGQTATFALYWHAQ
ncbi:MAG TPA: hypothetical protein VGH92_10840 [Gaiellaceae bacterium]